MQDSFDSLTDVARQPSKRAADGFFSGHSIPASVLVISSRMPALPEYFAHVNLYPMQFDEFLAATGQEWYSEVIRGHFKTGHRIPGIVHEELLDRFEDYLCTGGMPAAVNEYLSFETADNLPQIHQAYLGAILHDIYQHYEEGEAFKMCQVLEVLPAQLDKENQKFQYRLIRRGATKMLYQNAIQKLCDAQLIRLCVREGKEELFKVFPADIGLLRALAEEKRRKVAGPELLRQKEIENRPKKAGRFRSQLLECYVMQALSACCHQPEFWESTSQARIDFLLRIDGDKIPVEVKTAGNARSKSVSVYRASHAVPYSLKISGRNFEFANQVRTIPYYSVFCL